MDTTLEVLCTECGAAVSKNRADAKFTTCGNKCHRRWSSKQQAIQRAARKTIARIDSPRIKEVKAKIVPSEGEKFLQGMVLGISKRDLINAMRDVCESEQAEQFPLGKRSVFYEICNRGIIPGLTKQKYNALYGPINQACELGMLEDAWFVDSKRRLSHSRGDESVKEALLSRLGVTELDHWKDQPVVPVIMCEKDGHQGILTRITSPLQVRLFTSSGTWSRASLIKIANAIEPLVAQGKHVVVGYVGDHDPAGLYRIERTGLFGNAHSYPKAIGLKQHLAKIGVEQTNDTSVPGWSVEKVAMTTEQFQKPLYRNKLELFSKDEIALHTVSEVLAESELYTLNQEGKLVKADPNTREYVREFGLEKADVESLGFDGMRTEVFEFIKRHTDSQLWDESVQRSEAEVSRWKAIIDSAEEEEVEPMCSTSEPHLEGTCKWCNEPIYEAGDWIHKNKQVDFSLETMVWFAEKQLCEDGKHNAEPEEAQCEN